MNLNHDVQRSSKDQSYMNGSIDDFTDCIDFTKQYQKSCGLDEGNYDEVNELNTSTNESKGTINSDNSVDVDNKEAKSPAKSSDDKSVLSPTNTYNNTFVNTKHGNSNENEGEFHPMEPDVSITVGEANLEKTINHVAKGGEEANSSNDSKVLSDVGGSDSVKKKLNKQKLVKKNHLKLPVNKNIKKKVSLFKFKNGKHVKKQTDSFQYQGIQSNIKFKCYKCSCSDFSTISELQSHQRKCISGTPDFQSVNESAANSFSNSSSSNFKITRKVYLCSACGSYYENWNLFLHMKEMHKRHICLYCLGMFSQPDKLAQHLQAKHNVIEQNLSSTEEFFKLYRGPCYLICVSCESMFSEQEDFYEHSCVSSQADDSATCSLCGLQGAHFPTCRHSYSDRYLGPDPQISHPALGTKLSIKKKKVKGSKKEVFRIVNNEHNGEMSVVVRKQNVNDISDTASESRSRDYSLGHKDSVDKSPMSALLNSNEDLVSVKQYNEKMLQLYRPSKPSEKVISSIQSIEDSINRVVESLRMEDEEEDDRDYDGECEDEDEGEMNEDAPEEESSVYERDAVPSSGEQRPPRIDHQNEQEEGFSSEEKKDPEVKQSQGITLENSQAEEVNGGKNNEKDRNQVLSESESTDSEKLTIAFDAPSEQLTADTAEDKPGSPDVASLKPEDSIATAPKETSYIFVTLKEDCDDVKSQIKEFVKVSCWNCVYCSHAKRIALNGKQLALHILAEHRFVTVPEDSSEEDKELSAQSIIQRLKDSLVRLSGCYFNTDTFDSESKDFWKVNDRIYECFHCLFATYVHKELCSHNRKMHQKAMFLCIMCKSNFYTYSELLCHLCPGIYVSGQVINPDITYRCFLCDVDPMPSSFRLMVHLRRKHNSCDICFDQSSNQFQLSTHVWKHKLSHMCYRCGIAYRNKPDITKHLFWKHGTESVLCKKCLQKKWPHVYHFCVPPNSFICDECSVSLKSAVALKVHKRLHVGDYPYPCTKCEERFISRKLLGRHLDKHEEEENRPPEPEAPQPEEPDKSDEQAEEVKNPDADVKGSDETEKKPEKEKKSKKRKVLNDVFDLPPVNLSESDDSEPEETDAKAKVFDTESQVEEPVIPNGYLNGTVQKEEPSPTQIVDGVWNNFQNYLVAKDMPKTFRPASPFKNMTLSRIKEIMLSDHDYHIIPNSTSQDASPSKGEGEKSAENTEKVGLDHNYCNNVPKSKSSCKSKQKTKSHREDASKSSSSDSSSDSDSSCSCGSNCSCTSGSSSSTSSNDSDSDSREKRKQKKNGTKEPNVEPGADPEPPTEVDISVHDVPNENLIRESDLDTDETETDEDFYDYNPAREANRILAEKRTQLLANLNGSDVVTSSPSVGPDKTASPKKKAKFKKKRSLSRPSTASKNRKKAGASNTTFNRSRTSQFVAEGNGEGPSSVPYELPPQPGYNRVRLDISAQSPSDGDSRRPKRKRVPLKFYGFSSEDESEATPTSKKRDKSEHHTIIPAASSTPVATPPAHDRSEDATPTVWNPHSKGSLSWRVEKSDVSTPKVNPIKIRTSLGPKQVPVVEMAQDSESFQVRRFERNFQVNGGGNPVAQKGEKLYCFCQCPYDEVSEMIACDAEDCVIEWFHFECVGIMVPPKGSWYCPDCRKKLAAENEFLLPPTNEQNIN
ncbi:hypothetical protein RUM44_008737 [Polyplax serrata]|uniref:Chromatin modification-related protein YNG2 n=1 Tax=Polyplax serrata TaxID=468196 RepID=A0ABR1BDZ0_POLSC